MLVIFLSFWQDDQVEEFQPLCEVQSDKATIEITSRYKGKVAHLLYVPGDIVKVGLDTYECSIQFTNMIHVKVDIGRLHWFET